MKKNAGFTLIELIIYTGLTAIVIGLFAGIMVTIVRIQSQQTSSRQVASELNFVMNVIKRDIRDSTGLSVSASSITITNATSTSPIVIDLNAGAIRKSEAGGPYSNLTTDRVVADELSFTDLTSGSSEAVQIVITLSYNTGNPQQAFSQTLQATAAPILKSD